jgi:hypothetical protein
VATINKDFKVKNGLVVALGGSFGGTVTVEDPTLGSHAATKSYVDSVAGSPAIPVLDEAPPSPVNGSLWYDTVTTRLYIYYSGQWVAQANLADAEFLQDHIHDTSIDGNGLIVSKFIDGGYYYEPGNLVSAGFYDTTSWENTWVGGIAVDNFN